MHLLQQKILWWNFKPDMCHPFLRNINVQFQILFSSKYKLNTKWPENEWCSKGQSLDHGSVGIHLNASRSFTSEIGCLFYQGWSRMEKCCHVNSIMFWWGCFICNGDDPYASRGTDWIEKIFYKKKYLNQNRYFE